MIRRFRLNSLTFLLQELLFNQRVPNNLILPDRIRFRDFCNNQFKASIVLSLIIGAPFLAGAAVLKGTVTDARTHEPLVGTSLLLKNTTFGAFAGLDGTYVIRDVPAGDYVLMVSFVGYATEERQVSVKDVSQNVKFEFALTESFKDLDEVVVTGQTDKESDESVRRSEQKADNVLNIVSAKSIQLLPDITVGNILQRVSGVSITRNSSGDGQYAIIRGMDKRYTYTLVNGIKIPSPDNKNRYVPMDIFSGDLLERLEVIKALTPSMEGDAIGGAINMVMKSAPPSLTISATAAGGVSNIFSAKRPFAGFNTSSLPYQSPAALNGANYEAKPGDFGVRQLEYTNRTMPMNSLMSLSIGNRFFNNKLGVIVAGSYQNIFRGTNGVFYVPSQPLSQPTVNTYNYQEVQLRQFSNLQNRIGVIGKLDYVISQNHKLSLFNFFSQLDESQHRHYYNPLATGPGLATNDVHDRSRFTRQRITNSTLRGDHVLVSDLIKLDWTLVYSLATSTTPAWSDMNVRYRYDNGQLTGQELLPVTQIWTNNRDQDKSGYVNLSYNPASNLQLTGGGMTRFKTRDNVYTSYELNTTLPNTNGNYQDYTSIDKAVFSFLPSSNAYANPHDPNNYTAKENITAAYLQARYNFSTDFQVLGGLRNEMTLQEYHSQLDPTLAGRDGKISYSDLLPSVHFKYAVTEKQNLRLSYYKAIARPGYYDFVPVEISGDLFTENGNPLVRHTVADNYDLRYEFFNKGNEQIFAGVFYKKIMDPIEYGFIPVTVSTSNVIPQNYGTATNYGFELVVAKYVRNWGISGNYTYTNSSIIQSKGVIERFKHADGTGYDSSFHQDQKRPLQGQAKHIANVSLIYKDAQRGFDAQLSFVYTGTRINVVSPYKDLDYWQRGFSQLDFSAEKRFLKHFQVFTKITNLLNAPLVTEVHRPVSPLDVGAPAQDNLNRMVVQKEIFHQTFLLGVRFKIQ